MSSSDKSCKYFKPLYLIGPISAVKLYSKKYQKAVWLFGDEHVISPVCKTDISGDKKISIMKLIEKELNYDTNKLIDIYTETAFISRDIPERGAVGDSFLSLIRRQFEDCLQVDKSSCAFGNARFHYSDIRMYLHPEVIFFDLISLIVLDMSNGDFESAMFTWQKLLSSYRSYEVLRTFVSSYKFTDYLENTKILKQIKNVADPEVRNRLLSVLDEIVLNAPTGKQMMDLLDHVRSDSTDIDAIRYNDYDDEYYRQRVKIFNVNSRLMDVYILARMFRDFRKSPATVETSNGLEEGELPDRYSGPAKNIIVYAGDNHVRRMKKILTTLLDFKVLYEDESADKEQDFQCLGLSKVIFPLFR